MKSFVLLFATAALLSCASTKHTDIVLSANNPVISIDRSACFGSCPVYSMTLRGDGYASYIGKMHVDRIGHYRAKVDEQTLQFLAAELKRIDYFAMKDNYDAMVTDVPTITVNCTLNDSTKTIVDRFGAPTELREFENTLDSVAKTIKWMKVAAE